MSARLSRALTDSIHRYLEVGRSETLFFWPGPLSLRPDGDLGAARRARQADQGSGTSRLGANTIPNAQIQASVSEARNAHRAESGRCTVWPQIRDFDQTRSALRDKVKTPWIVTVRCSRD